MKTGIITLLGNNYGNRLQNYAVQELLKEYGDVYTVKYEKKTSSESETSKLARYNPAHIKKAIDSRLLNIYHLSNRDMNTVTRALYFAKHRGAIKNAMVQRDAAFRLFDEKYISYESEMLHLTGDDKESWVLDYDAWICGSDQIWNPTYPTATRNAFLQFAQKERRISLSASIGLSSVQAMPLEYKTWMNEIPYMSVREERAAEIVNELTGCMPEVFLDPTMLLPLEKWINIADEADTNLPSKYAVGYFLGVREKEYQKYIRSKIKNISYVDLLNAEETKYLAFGPAEVVDAIRNAEIVFVDSFHGAVFSILFHKQFVVFERREEGQTMNSRLETLLKRFGLEKRIFSKENLETLDQTIDYSKVDEVIKEERHRVRKFLNNAMYEISQLTKDYGVESKHICVNRPEKCSGCSACRQICPKQCITLKEDLEGFMYPNVDTNVCINCGLCKKVCPVLNNDQGNEPTKVLALKNKNENIRATSSSGGTFFELARKFLEEGGIVYGCALDENMVARHIKVTSESDLHRLKSSKYVQSDMGDTMREIRTLLSEEKKVMFSGTPCQTAGLVNYIGKKCENLFLVDILCHGVPSPKLFREYLELLEKQYAGKAISVNFRSKQRGWKRLYMEVCFNNGKRHYVYSGYDRYESLFLNNMSLRPSCYECKFTTTKRYGDITLGDFWGIGKRYPEWDDDKGISVVMLNTKKGQEYYQKISSLFVSREEKLELAKAGQRTLYAPTAKNPNRDAFYEILAKDGCQKALENYTRVPGVLEQAYYATMRWGLDIIRKILRKGY